MASRKKKKKKPLYPYQPGEVPTDEGMEGWVYDEGLETFIPQEEDVEASNLRRRIRKLSKKGRHQAAMIADNRLMVIEKKFARRLKRTSK